MEITACSGGYGAGDFAKIMINGVPVVISKNEHNHFRGLHVVVIDPTSGNIISGEAFDTHKTIIEFENFVLTKIPEGHIIAVAC